MQVRCPNCSTAYEIPPPTRPRRLRCARCETEWRVLPPDAEADPAEPDPVAMHTEPTVPAAVTEPVAPAIVPMERMVATPMEAAPAEPAGVSAPLVGEPIRPPVPVPATGPVAGMVWLALWVLSLALIAGTLFAAWHFRVALEHGWPPILRVFRLLPGGVPRRAAV